MSFRTQVESDLTVFLPLAAGRDSEFDEMHSLDDEYEVACILVEVDAISIGATARASEFLGVSTYDATLYVRASDYAAPVVDQKIKIDERYAIVISVTDEQGMRLIRLRWWNS